MSLSVRSWCDQPQGLPVSVTASIVWSQTLKNQLTKDPWTQNQSKGQGQGDLIPGECQRRVHHSIGHAMRRSAGRVGTVPCQQNMSSESDVLTGYFVWQWFQQNSCIHLTSQGSAFVTRTRWQNSCIHLTSPFWNGWLLEQDLGFVPSKESRACPLLHSPCFSSKVNLTAWRRRVFLFSF